MIVRDKPMIPCQIQWDYRSNFLDVLIPPDPLDDQDISVDILGEWREDRNLNRERKHE